MDDLERGIPAAIVQEPQQVGQTIGMIEVSMAD
jgi:hypothetical protein